MMKEGSLTIRADLIQGMHANIAVELCRPPVSRLFLGQSPEVVLKRVPYLYNLCAQAQTAAAQAALSVATGEQAGSVDATELWVELLHENLWRLMLDWPEALGVPPNRGAFVAWRTRRHSEDVVVHTRKIILDEVGNLADQCLEKLRDNGDEKPLEETHLNPGACMDVWLERSVSQPVMQRPVSILAAYRARLSQLQQALLALENACAYPLCAVGRNGASVAQTLTARGVLTHAVQVEQGLVTRYAVWAPTDSLFADPGALTSLLAGQQCDSAAEADKAMQRAVLALDPCVPYVVEINNA